MNANVILFAWNRSLPGRETMSSQHFQEFSEYLGLQQRAGAVQSFDVVILEPHGGTVNGFFLIRGEPAKLAELTGSEEWMRHQVRGLLHLDGAATLRGFSGAPVAERMAAWNEQVAKL